MKIGFSLNAIQQTFIFAISLAVAAIPESLPTITTIVLSMGVSRMSKRNAVVKKLSSVETLGSTTVICTDKTGTITENKMKIEKIYFNDIEFDVKNPIDDYYAFKKLQEVCYFNNNSVVDTNKEIGDPTEIALLNLSKNLDKKYKDIRFKRIFEEPFDSIRKMMSTVNLVDNNKNLYTKGAFEEVSKLCSHVIKDEKIILLDIETRRSYDLEVTKLSKKGFRVLSLAYKEIEGEDYSVNNLILIGLVAIRDPIRPEVFSAIEKCKNAGIRVIMATGDHVETAKSYAIELNIMNHNDKAYSHSEIENMSDDELKEILQRVSVFARINPEDKYRIVTLLKEMGEIVAMTGDGVNDAPALRKADIGIAMGLRGTDLAREVAVLVLLDDNFASIVNAIEEGRVIYDNIKNSIFFLLSCNFGEIMLVLASMILSMGLPLGPLHLLWLNLVTDSFPALALGFEKPNKDIMKPRIKKRMTL